MADPDLINWCTRHGVIFNGIVADFVMEGWRGIVATKDLQAGEVVLRVPEQLLLTTRSAARDPLLSAALKRHQLQRNAGASGGSAAAASGAAGLSAFQVLACHLLLEVSRGPESFWWPYLKKLPRSYTSLANFGLDDAAALQLQHARDAAAAAAERAREEWQEALPVLQELGLPKRFTVLRAWLWAASTLHSRTMYLPWCPAGALTPYGDLHNYQPPPPPYTPELGCPAAPREAARRAAAAASHSTGPREQLDDLGAARDGTEAVDDEAGGVGAVASTVSEPLKPLPASRTVDAGSRQDEQARCASGAGGSVGPFTCGGGGDGSGADSCCGGMGVRPNSCGSMTGSAAITDASAHDVATASAATTAAALAAAALALADASPAAVRSGGICRTAENDSSSHGDTLCGGGEAGAACVSGAGPRPPAHAAGGSSVASPQGKGDGDEVGSPADDGDCSTIAGDGMWDEAAQQYCIIVRRPYCRGEQVMLCYGRYTNLELLEHYGFVLQDNPFDTAQLDPALLPLPAAARAAAGAPYVSPEDCFLHANGQPSWQLLHLLRYCAATPAERRTAGHLMAAGERASEQGDRQALRWLHSAVSRQLEELPTTMRHDQDLTMQLKQSSPLPPPQQQQQQQQHLCPQQQAQAQLAEQTVGPETRPGEQQRQQQEQLQEEEQQRMRGTDQAQARAAAAGVEGGGGSGARGGAEAVVLEGCRVQERTLGQRAAPALSASGGEGTSQEDVTGATPSASASGSASASEPASGAATASGREATAATAAAAALSDGLTCAGLALQWRIQQKRILLRALRCAEEVLGPAAAVAGEAASGRQRAVPRNLNALMQQQRARRHIADG